MAYHKGSVVLLLACSNMLICQNMCIRFEFFYRGYITMLPQTKYMPDVTASYERRTIYFIAFFGYFYT